MGFGIALQNIHGVTRGSGCIIESTSLGGCLSHFFFFFKDFCGQRRDRFVDMASFCNALFLFCFAFFPHAVTRAWDVGTSHRLVS